MPWNYPSTPMANQIKELRHCRFSYSPSIFCPVPLFWFWLYSKHTRFNFCMRKQKLDYMQIENEIQGTHSCTTIIASLMVTLQPTLPFLFFFFWYHYQTLEGLIYTTHVWMDRRAASSRTLSPEYTKFLVINYVPSLSLSLLLFWIFATYHQVKLTITKTSKSERNMRWNKIAYSCGGWWCHPKTKEKLMREKKQWWAKREIWLGDWAKIKKNFYWDFGGGLQIAVEMLIDSLFSKFLFYCN